MYQLQVYMNDHPELKRVSQSEHSDILKWAERKRYIKLKRFGKILFYTDQDLETALMWSVKDDYHRS